MDTQKHIISKLTVDVECFDEENAHKIKDNITDLIREFLLKEIEKYVDSLNENIENNDIVQIDKLTIDIASGSADIGDREFKMDIELAMKKNLEKTIRKMHTDTFSSMKKRYSNVTKEILEKAEYVDERSDATVVEWRKIDEQNRRLNVWFTFLKEGKRPWWAKNREEFNAFLKFDSVLNQMVKKPDIFRKKLIIHFGLPQFRDRLLAQYNQTAIAHLLTLVCNQKLVQSNSGSFSFEKAISIAFSKPEYKEFVTVFWNYLMSEANKTNGNIIDPAEIILSKFIEKIKPRWESNESLISENNVPIFIESIFDLLDLLLNDGRTSPKKKLKIITEQMNRFYSTQKTQGAKLNSNEEPITEQSEETHTLKNTFKKEKEEQEKKALIEIDPPLETFEDEVHSPAEKDAHELMEIEGNVLPNENQPIDELNKKVETTHEEFSGNDPSVEKSNENSADVKSEPQREEHSPETINENLEKEEIKISTDKKLDAIFEKGENSIKDSSFETFVPSESTNKSTSESTSESIKKANQNDELVIQDAELDFPTEEKLRVDNAGLILIHPFLKHFFQKNRLLLDGNRLKDKVLSAHILHFIATGVENDFEHAMLIEKFLVGLPIGWPMERYIAISDEIKEEVSALLNAVKTKWPSMKSSSNEALQVNFLRREGILFDESPQPRLKVERQTIDILLNEVDWNYSLVKLPWKKKMLFVDW